MSYFLNIGLAWVTVILGVLTSVIYVLRFLNKKFKGKNVIVKSLNKHLRKHHKTLGIAMVFTGLIHGIYSSSSVLSFNMGTVCWIVIILLGINWMIRKKFKNKNWIFYHRFLTLIFIITLLSHIYLVSDYNVFSQSDKNVVHKTIDTNDIKLKDGKYTGVSLGYKDGLTVEVTISNNKISNIDILSHNETKGFYEKPFEEVTKAIIEKQSLDVDIISGATKTSNGIISAVYKALQPASPEGSTILKDYDSKMNSSKSLNNPSTNEVDSSAKNTEPSTKEKTSSVKDDNSPVNNSETSSKNTSSSVKDDDASSKDGNSYVNDSKTSSKEANSSVKNIEQSSENVDSSTKEDLSSNKGKVIKEEKSQIESTDKTNKSNDMNNVDSSGNNDTIPNNTDNNDTTELPSETENDSSSEENKTENTKEEDQPSIKKYNDGTFSGEADGFQPALIVNVTISNDKIVNINIVEHNESEGFFEKPFETIPSDIINKQSLSVDTISGATYTSNGIINAVKAALEKAKI